MRAIIFWALLGLIRLAESQSQASSALIVHNIKNFQVTHSELVRSLKRRFESVIVKDVKAAASFKAKRDKRFVFDLAVLILAKSDEVLTITEKLELFEFYDQGGKVLIMGDNFISQNFRITLSLFGFDALMTANTPESFLNLQSSPYSHTLFIPKEQIPFEFLSKNLKKGILFEGNGLSLTPYDTPQMAAFIPLPPKSVLFTPANDTQQILDSTACVMGYAQGRNVPARIVAVGGFKVFGNEFIERSEGDNAEMMEAVLDWLEFKNLRVRVENFAICGEVKEGCEQVRIFKQRDKVAVMFQAFDEQGRQVEDPSNFFLRLKMYEIFLMQPFKRVDFKGKMYFLCEFEAFEHIGVYMTTIIYNKPGYLFEAPGTQVELIFRIFRDTSSQIFDKEALPFLIAILLVMLGACSVVWFSLNSVNKKE